MTKQSLEQIEERIEEVEKLLLQPLDMAAWSAAIGEYNYLKIKLAQVKGEKPSVTEGKTDYII